MTYHELLGRQSEMLRKNIQQQLISKNQNGQNAQQGFLLKQMIKEYHQKTHEIHSIKSGE